MTGLSILKKLCGCISTSGDEATVFALLEREWKAAGLKVTRHGYYAVSARKPSRRKKPVLLITAHADSPGYSVDITGEKLHAVEIGSPHFEETAEAVLNGQTVTLTPDTKNERGVYITPAVAAEAGDRLAFKPSFELRGSVLQSPFLDNRLGCWLLCLLAPEIKKLSAHYDIVLGVTGSEEMCGFGARVLADAIKPDLVFVIDATYEAKLQNVFLGKGPVLTLSDSAVLISPALRDKVKKWFADAGVPLQTEVYNFSGTDAKAFPPALVLPLLIPSRGAHSRCETADLNDVTLLLQAIRFFALGGVEL